MTQGTAGRRRAAGWAVLAAGLCASAAGVVLAVQPARPPAAAGEIPPAAQPTTRPTTAAPATAAPTSRPATVPPTVPPTKAARPARTTADPVWAVPTRLTIGAIKVDAPIDPAGVRPDRSLAVPEDPSRLGWWIGSAAPGAKNGTVLVAGHVDTARDGKGALFPLEKLAMGARIDVRAGDAVTSYRVVARRSYAKQRLPAELYQPGTAPRLALVTCGGAFVDGVYSHNVVVYAEPLGR